jgi:hypothetical protein
MDGLDEQLSTPCMFIAAFALLHAPQQCMSGSGLFPQASNPYAGRACGATGLQAQAAMASLTPGAPSFGWIAHQSIIPVSTDVDL